VQVEGALACVGLLIILGVGYIAFGYVKNFLIRKGFPQPSKVGIIVGIASPFIIMAIFGLIVTMFFMPY